MRNRKTTVKGLKKSTTLAEVVALFFEWFDLVKESGTAGSEVATAKLQQFAKKIKELESRDALHILCVDLVGPVARQLAPFNTFPTKKVRFNVFPASMEKLERVAKACGTKTKKGSIDTVLEFLCNRLPPEYWNRKAEVAALLSNHLPGADHTTPVSLAMNALWYALLQDLAELLGESQGAVLEAAIEMWLINLEMRKAKRKEALKIITEFESQADAMQGHLEEILDGDDPICSRFGIATVVLMNLRMAIEDNINEDVPIDPHGLL